MKEFYAQPGDILIYSDAKTDIDKLIQYGEKRIRGMHVVGPVAYHCAVALDAYYKVEADAGGVKILPIDYGNCSVFRPPYERDKLDNALAWAKQQGGKLYGWLGVIDQGLRDLTFNRVHLPRAFIEWADKRWPYCSALDAGVMVRAGYNKKVPKQHRIPKWPPLDPEAILLLVHQWPVKP